MNTKAFRILLNKFYIVARGTMNITICDIRIYVLVPGAFIPK